MFDRLKRAVEAGKAAIEDAQGSDTTSTQADTPVLALLALDRIGPGADGLAERHLAAAQSIGARPLFVLGPESADDLAAYERLCEFLPLPEDLSRTTGDRPDVVEQYIRRRLRHVLDKWSVKECRWIGESAAELVDAWARDDDRTLRPVYFRPAP